MSGPMPSHLVRRGAMYQFRIRLPADLARQLGIVEFRRSLFTRSPGEARRRCVEAHAWLCSTLDRLRSMPAPTRLDLEKAAQRYFARLSADLDRPRRFNPEAGGGDIDENVELSRAYISRLRDQLRENVFDVAILSTAQEMVRRAGFDLEGGGRAEIVAAQLVARAEIELHQRFIHQLHALGEHFTGDGLFVAPARTLVGGDGSAPIIAAADGPTLGELASKFLKRKGLSGVGSSQITELTRMLTWLQEVVSPNRPITSITKAEMRAFRDGIERLDVRLRGRNASFQDRQTEERGHQIKTATSGRYWASCQAFFAWAVNEGHLTENPAQGLSVEPRRDEVKRTPPPFSQAELERLFASPLYRGSQSPRRLLNAGDNQTRYGHWWSGILALFTGLRAGELGQLTATDFSFDAEVPHIAVTTLDEDGRHTKRTKNKSSVRDVPLHPDLLKLGLEEFVNWRSRRDKFGRIFIEFRPGSIDRNSEGLTAFWGRYLRKFELWAEGRSTHVFRHTLADRLRANGAASEDIGAILGHAGRTITDQYGGGQPLSRKARTLGLLDYGIDIIAAVGGPYDPARHGCGPAISRKKATLDLFEPDRSDDDYQAV